MAWTAPPGPATRSVEDAARWFSSGGLEGAGRSASKFVPRTVKAVRSGGDDAARGIRNFFSRTPKKAPVLPVRPNPVQAGEDVVRAVTDITPSTPAAGRAGTYQFPTAFVVKTAAVGGLVGGSVLAAPRIGSALSQIGTGAGAGAGAAIQQPLSGLGLGLSDAFAGLGTGLANALAGIGLGTGAGLGGGVAEAGKGVGAAIKAVAIPALLVGAGFLAFTAIKKK